MLGKSILNRTLIIVGFLALVFVCQVKGYIDTEYLCLNPDGGNWWRIFTYSLLHGDLSHLVGNATALIVSLPVLFFLYDYAWKRVLVAAYIIPGIFTCMMGLRGLTLGISGLVYGVIFYIIIMGLRSKTTVRFITAIVFLFFYSGSIAGATPLAYQVSWEGHLGGIVAAFICAYTIEEEA